MIAHYNCTPPPPTWDPHTPKKGDSKSQKKRKTPPPYSVIPTLRAEWHRVPSSFPVHLPSGFSLTGSPKVHPGPNGLASGIGVLIIADSPDWKKKTNSRRSWASRDAPCHCSYFKEKKCKNIGVRPRTNSSVDESEPIEIGVGWL